MRTSMVDLKTEESAADEKRYDDDDDFYQSTRVSGVKS